MKVPILKTFEQGPCLVKQAIAYSSLPTAIGPFSQAIRANGFIFASAQPGFDPVSGTLVTEGFEAQLRQILENLTAILCSGGGDWRKVVKVCVFLTDMKDYPQFNEIYVSFLDGPAPAYHGASGAAAGGRIGRDRSHRPGVSTCAYW